MAMHSHIFVQPPWRCGHASTDMVMPLHRCFHTYRCGPGPMQICLCLYTYLGIPPHRCGHASALMLKCLQEAELLLQLGPLSTDSHIATGSHMAIDCYFGCHIGFSVYEEDLEKLKLSSAKKRKIDLAYILDKFHNIPNTKINLG